LAAMVHRAVDRLDLHPGSLECALAGSLPVLRAAESGARAATPARRNVHSSRSCQPDDVPLTLLIVDDNAAFRDIARRLLERNGLQVVGVAATIAEALAQVGALDPRVVLVDIHLGGESGFELADKLALGTGAGRAVVLMSTHSADELVDLIAASPAAGFIPKVHLSAEAILALVAESG
jgi:two-component system nitrate/nitrite response regulator NarL